MSKLIRFSLLLGLALGTTAGVGCGSDGTECGSGTVDMGGVCVPAELACSDGTVFNAETQQCELDETGPECGAGTVRMGDACVPEGGVLTCADGTSESGGECVVDGTVVCTGATRFNADTGVCEVDPDAICEDGAVYSMADDECILFDDSLEATADIAEDGDWPAAGGEEDLPELAIPDDGSAVSVYGCVELTTEDGVVQGDRDSFSITVTEPTLLDVQVDGLRGLSAAATVVTAEEEGIVSTWSQRFILDLANDGVTGQVFLPGAGTYNITFGDARDLRFTDGVAGLPAGTDPVQCYFAQVAEADIPMPTAITAGTPVEAALGNPAFYSYTATENTALGLGFTELNAEGVPGNVDNVFGQALRLVDNDFRGAVGSGVIGVDMGQEVLFVVDATLDLRPDATDFRLTVNEQNHQDLVDGENTVSHTDAEDERDPTAWSYLRFSATAGDVINIDLSTADDDSFVGAILNADGEGVLLQTRTGTFDELNEFVVVPETGDYFLALYNTDGEDGMDYTFTGGLRSITPATPVAGTALPIDLDADEDFFGFVNVALGANSWTGWDLDTYAGDLDGEDARLEFFIVNSDTFGVLGRNISTARTERIGADDDGIEQIAQEAASFLVRVANDDDAGAIGGSVELTENPVPFQEVALVRGTPVMRAGDTAAAAEGRTRYIATFDEETIMPLDEVRLSLTTGTATLDGTLDFVNVRGASTLGANDAGAGEAETLSALAANGFMPFVITDASGTGGTYDLSVAFQAGPYSVAAAPSTYTSICTADNVLFDEDDGVSDSVALDMFGFNFFGVPVTEMVVASNGWITFDGTYTGNSNFSSQNNAIVVEDADVVPDEICVAHTPTSVTIEFEGATYGFFEPGEPVHMQIVLHADGRIDMNYSSAHNAFDGGAFLVNQDGSFSVEYPEARMAGTTLTWTPAAP